MNHLGLFFICLLSVEIFIKLNYFACLNLIIKLSKKSIHIISNKKISDHWKENIIPKYSIFIMKSSLQMLLVFILIIFMLFTVDIFFNGFFLFIFSLSGIIESVLIAFSYAYIRKLIFK